MSSIVIKTHVTFHEQIYAQGDSATLLCSEMLGSAILDASPFGPEIRQDIKAFKHKAHTLRVSTEPFDNSVEIKSDRCYLPFEQDDVPGLLPLNRSLVYLAHSEYSTPFLLAFLLEKLDPEDTIQAFYIGLEN